MVRYEPVLHGEESIACILHGKESILHGEERLHGEESILYGEESILYGEESILHGEESILHGEESILHGEESILHGEESILHGEESILHGEESILHGEESILHGEESISAWRGEYICMERRALHGEDEPITVSVCKSSSLIQVIKVMSQLLYWPNCWLDHTPTPKLNIFANNM